MTNKETLDLSLDLGIGVKTHSSGIEEAQADRVRRRAEREGLTRPEQPEEPKPAKPAKATKATKAAKSTKQAAKAPDEAPAPAAEAPSSAPAEAPAPAAPEPVAASAEAPAPEAPPQQTPPTPSRPAPGGSADGWNPRPSSPPAAPPQRTAGRPAPPPPPGRLVTSSGSERPPPPRREDVPARPAASAAPAEAPRAPERPAPRAPRPTPPPTGRPTAPPPGAPRPPAGGPPRPSAPAPGRPNPTSSSGKPIPPPPGPPASLSGKPIPPPPGLGGRGPAPSRGGRPGGGPAGRGTRPGGPPSGGGGGRPGGGFGGGGGRPGGGFGGGPGGGGPGGAPGGGRPGGGPRGGGQRPPRRRGRRRRSREELQPMEAPSYTPASAPVPEGTIVVERASTPQDLGPKLNRTAADVVRFLLQQGEMVTATQSLTDDMIELFAAEIGADIHLVDPGEEQEVELQRQLGFDELFDSAATDDTDPRPPVITVMGHVDHGKTKLLDRIRNANVVEGEAGGITQHIGAYQTEKNGRRITFIDTPGHEAFTAMRARGAEATDIVVLVVAADDGVMPQTIEALNHAKAAEVPIVVAINKVDREQANVDRVKQQLSDQGLIPSDWGGDVEMVQVSALQGLGIDELLETLLLVADVQDPPLEANVDGRAAGVVLEANLDVGRGPVASILVPAPFSLNTSSAPPSTSARSRIPMSPCRSPGTFEVSKPRPSSSTARRTCSGVATSRTITRPASACLATLVRASWQMR